LTDRGVSQTLSQGSKTDRASTVGHVWGVAGDTELEGRVVHLAVWNIDTVEALTVDPCSSWKSSQAVTAVVVGCATAWNAEALGLGGAPGLCSSANASVVVAVVLGWKWASRGDVVALTSGSAQSCTDLEGQDVTTYVPSGGTRRHSDTCVRGSTVNNCCTSNGVALT